MTDKTNVIVDIDYMQTTLQVVKKENGCYDVQVGEEVKHPDVDHHGVMRALGHYLHGINYQLEKEKLKSTTNTKVKP